MNNTGVYINELPPKHEAKGYTLEGDKFILAVDWYMSYVGGAGALYSTIEDLFLWNEALFNGKVLSEESLNAAHTPVKLNNGEIGGIIPYDYGWAIDRLRGMKYITHGGGLYGFRSNLSRITDKNLSIVILANSPLLMEGRIPSEVDEKLCEFDLDCKYYSLDNYLKY